MADWLSCHNHVENKDQEILGMNVSILNISTSVDIPLCTSIEDIQTATEEYLKLQMLQRYIIRGWPLTKEVGDVRGRKTLANKA